MGQKARTSFIGKYCHNLVTMNDDDPYNTKLDEIESLDDSQDSDINDSHYLNDSNDSNDSNSDSEDESKCSSSKTSLSKSSSIDVISDIQYDEELEALKQELNQFKRRNNNDLRRTRSQEQILLSVLNIDQKDIDAEQLEKCTKNAINKYNTMTLREKRRIERTKNMKTKNNDKQKSKQKKRRRKLADPYEQEWNGLDPDDYQWFDNVPEGECYDDKELSLRNRRIQYLVVMAIENNYCTISDLSYDENELLLKYQCSHYHWIK